jgi:hypothetical protein
MLSRFRVALLVLAAAVVACADRTAAPTASDEPALSPAKTSTGGPDRRRLEQLAARLARSLADPAVRARVKQDLDRSPVREHKVQFQRLLADGARPAAVEIARATGAPAAAVTAEALAASPLELYLPVPEHRARWTGDANILVATAVNDHEPPIAFDPSGRRFVLDPDVPPATPVLALVPEETNFDGPEVVAAPLAVEVCPQSAARTPAPGGIQAQGCAPGGSQPSARGLWMTAASFVGTFEGWLKGAPEFEVHVLGQAGTSDSLKDYQCAGEKQAAPYWFDQNATTWTGNVMIMSQAQLDSYRQQHPGQSVRVVVIEDDDTACQLKLDSGRLATVLKTLDAQYRNLTGGRDTTGTLLTRYWNRASAFQKILQSLWSLITTQDEFVGNAVEDAVAGEFKSGYNWIVKGENSITNGALKLEMR